MERLELRARVLELENKLLLAHLDSMINKLCFCTWAEVTSQVGGSELSDYRKTEITSFRSTKPSPSSSMPMSLRTILHTLRRMPSLVLLNKPLLNVQWMFPS